MLKCFDLTGDTAMITGAGKGLGASYAEALAQSGADLMLLDIVEEGVAKVSRHIQETYGVRCEYAVANIADERQVQAAVDRCVSVFGKLDILVNNAASMRNNIPVDDTAPEAFEAVMTPNVTGTLIVSKAAAKEMRKRKKGRIVNIASVSGLIVNKGVHGGSYEVSKAAVIMLTKTLATAWCKDGISVNAICPGYYGTDPNKDFFAKDPGFYHTVIDMIPMGRLGEPEELWGTLLLLCSSAASYMHGAAIPVDGGYTLW